MTAEHEPQRIARLTPLPDVLARIDALVVPVKPRRITAAAAVGRVLVEDVVAPGAIPAAARALCDGFAVASEAMTDASSYAPVPLVPARRVEVGDELPEGTDAVAALETVAQHGGGLAITAPVAPGEGVLRPGVDMDAGTILRPAGHVLRASDIAALTAAGIGEVSVREPLIHLLKARPGPDAVLDAAVRLIRAGGTAGRAAPAVGDVPAALADRGVDAVVIVGGTGVGRHDASVRALAAAGRVEVHGVAVSPGESAAFGLVDTRPVLLIPGRLDAALAIWLTLGRHLLARLAGVPETIPTTAAVLARKLASPLGLTELVPVRFADGKAEPIASGYWPLQSFTQADGWILVPPDSEGYPAGAQVMVRAWP